MSEPSWISVTELLESLPHPLILCDPQGALSHINAAARHMLGLEPDQPLETITLHLNERDTFLSTRQRRHPHGLHEFFMADVLIDGAQRASISMTLVPLDSGGYRIQLVDSPHWPGGAQDAMARLKPLLEQLDVPCALFDLRRALRAANPAMSKLLGLDVESLYGQDLVSLVAADQQEPLRLHVAQVLAGQQAEPPLMLIGASGRRVHLRVSALNNAEATAHESPEGFMLIALPELQDARDLEAEQMHRLGQLASNVAHELKNPLTSILNYADFLLKKYREQLFERRDQERLERIIAGVERMDRFIAELVELTREPNQRAFERLELEGLINEAIALCEVQLSMRHVSVELELEHGHAMHRGSRAQLVQVFVNLLTNACMAYPELEPKEDEAARKIWVRTRQVSRQMLEIEIEDHGHGIASEHLSHIFEPFFTTRKAQGGSGLGLVLVRSMIEHHGGKVSVVSELAHGTRFTVSLPICQDP